MMNNALAKCSIFNEYADLQNDIEIYRNCKYFIILQLSIKTCVSDDVTFQHLRELFSYFNKTNKTKDRQLFSQVYCHIPVRFAS